ncbi:MAG TPA: response regulator [Flavisolibacter sp.]|jgi:CheY-like chemotaxis protein
MEASQKVILYVDDDPDDREFLIEAIKKENPDVKLLLAGNGLEAIDCLLEMKETNTSLPSLIILDINMPFLDGRETFERIQKDPDLKKIPVLVLSSSEKPNDKAMFRNLGIEYITKPADINHLYLIANRMVGLCR